MILWDPSKTLRIPHKTAGSLIKLQEPKGSLMHPQLIPQDPQLIPKDPLDPWQSFTCLILKDCNIMYHVYS